MFECLSLNLVISIDGLSLWVLYPSERILDDTDWFEFQIETFRSFPEKYYDINFTYRNKQLLKVNAMIENYEIICNKLIKLFEEK